MSVYAAIYLTNILAEGGPCFYVYVNSFYLQTMFYGMKEPHLQTCCTKFLNHPKIINTKPFKQESDTTT